MRQQDYAPSIDWLKAIGITLIVIGHVAHAGVAGLVPPIYPKQLGVAMFLYASAYALARERRSPGRAVANRMFEVWLFGVPCALILSAIGLIGGGDLVETNYLPFAFGANVALNYFPANPTTWFVGTYLHILVVWALALRRVTVTPWMIAATAASEILVRTLLMQSAGEFVAYMALSNWATVFMLGLMHGQRRDEAVYRVGRVTVDTVNTVNTVASGFSRKSGFRLQPEAWWPEAWCPEAWCPQAWWPEAWRPLLALAAFLLVWPRAIDLLPRSTDFPFMYLAPGWTFAALATSAAASLVYVTCTLLTVAITRAVMAPAAVRFVARNTMIVFLAHMPIFWGLQPLVRSMTDSYWGRVAIHMVPCYVVLLALSELIRRAINPVALRESLYGRVASSISGLKFRPGRSEKISSELSPN